MSDGEIWCHVWTFYGLEDGVEAGVNHKMDLELCAPDVSQFKLGSGGGR